MQIKNFRLSLQLKNRKLVIVNAALAAKFMLKCWWNTNTTYNFKD